MPYTCTHNTLVSFPGPRPWPACNTLVQLPVACSTVTASDGKLSEGLGKRLVARAVSAYQSSKQVVVCCLQASCFTNPQHYCAAGNKTCSKLPIRNVSLPLRCCYTLNKLDASSNGIHAL